MLNLADLCCPSQHGWCKKMDPCRCPPSCGQTDCTGLRSCREKPRPNTCRLHTPHHITQRRGGGWKNRVAWAGYIPYIWRNYTKEVSMTTAVKDNLYCINSFLVMSYPFLFFSRWTHIPCIYPWERIPRVSTDVMPISLVLQPYHKDHHSAYILQDFVANVFIKVTSEELLQSS